MRPWVLISLAVILIASLAVCPTSLAQKINSDSKRRIVSQEKPTYPPVARRMHLTGTVRLYATVAPNGKVVQTEVVGGSPIFAQSATTAVAKFTWEPRQEETKELVEVNFQLDTE